MLTNTYRARSLDRITVRKRACSGLHRGRPTSLLSTNKPGGVWTRLRQIQTSCNSASAFCELKNATQNWNRSSHKSPLVRRRAKCWPMSGAWLTNRTTGPFRKACLRREIQLESDPKEKLRLGLDLARFQEAAGDLAAAQAQIESVYQANPLISGVIRATVDYYWRHDKPRAIRVLTASAERAHPSLKKDYLVETVHKSIEAKQLTDATQAAQQLLQIDPIDGQFVALMADALSAGGKQAELQQLYTTKISEIQQASIPTADKTDRTAAMRRGLIPVLARESKFREAIDQYIEIINRYPEDTNVLAEAGRFASQHNLRPQLIDYYGRTSTNSPRDPRWFIVLARLQAQFGNYPAAIDAYSKAMVARPERLDLATSKADLEERTFRFADAINTYNRLFDLSHKNPIWLERIARLQARLGQNREAVSTLQRAYIDNRPEPERQYSKVAFILEELGLLDNAADFIRQDPESVSGYVRIMARVRRYDDAIQRVFDNNRTWAPLKCLAIPCRHTSLLKRSRRS